VYNWWRIVIVPLLLWGIVRPRAPLPAHAGSLSEGVLETLLDEQMTALLAEYHIPGGVIAVVQDGAVVHAQGYGWADLEAQTPMQADTTLVRIASITKLFTWTAVMQLVEQGRVDLDADIATYLDFEIPRAYPGPITLRRLLSHTAGFEDRNILTGALTPYAGTLRDALVAYIPAQIYAPGAVIAYSNYGAALAGYIVARVSGLSWEEYVETHLLAPLEMHRTTPREPLPDDLQRDLAASYVYSGGQQQRSPFLFCATPPDGAISATATDMARFMLAHLQDGAYGDARILQEPTARQMHSQLYTHDPLLPGYAHGFDEIVLNNQRVIYHDGGWEEFASILWLAPEHNVGMFVAFNGSAGAAALGKIAGVFMNHFFPAPEDTPTLPDVAFQPDAQRFSGAYRPARAAFRTVERLLWLQNAVHIAAPAQDALTFKERTWTQVSPLCFRRSDRPRYLCFREDAAGQPWLVTTGTVDYVRLAWYQTLSFNSAFLAVCAVAFLSAAIAWPLAAGRQVVAGFPTAQGVVIGMACAGVLTLLTMGALVLWESETFLYRVPVSYQLARGLLWIFVAAVVAVVICAGLAWVRRPWPAGWLGYYTVLAVIGVACAAWLLYWRVWTVG
jgi:CubicO group peptidase (beta-lactamase class C family)